MVYMWQEAQICRLMVEGKGVCAVLLSGGGGGAAVTAAPDVVGVVSAALGLHGRYGDSLVGVIDHV